LQNGTVNKSDFIHYRKLNISNLLILQIQAPVWREAQGQDPCSCLKKPVIYHNWFALPEKLVSDARAPFVLPEYLKMVLSKNVMRSLSLHQLGATIHLRPS
jgi:hypothetical protein